MTLKGKLHNRFSWFSFFLWTISYGVIILLIDLVEGKFKEPNINITKLIVGYILQFSMYGLIMSLVFGLFIPKKKTKIKNENKN